MNDRTIIFPLLLGYSLLLLTAGLHAFPDANAVESLWKIQCTPSLLLTDYTLVGGR